MDKVTYYKVSAMAIGLGGFIACGGGGSGTTNTPPATEAQQTQVAALVPGFLNTVSASPNSGQARMVVGKQDVPVPLLIPALANMSGCGSVTFTLNTVKVDFTNCPGMSGSITFSFTASVKDSTTTFDGQLTYDHVEYTDGIYHGSINGSANYTLTNTYTLTDGFSFTRHIVARDLSFTDNLGNSWTTQMDQYVNGSVSGLLVIKSTGWGTASYAGTAGNYSVNIPQNNPINYDSSQCPQAPKSGSITWTANNNAVIHVTFGPDCGSFSVDGVIHKLN